MTRAEGRFPEQPRHCDIQAGFIETADGSCLISVGKTRVICTASVEEGVPPFLRGSGRGWVTAEYAMLPASTGQRKARDGIKKDGRGVEIQRLIGRSLRQAVDMRLLGERTIALDCDVLQADGGTRAASITGAYVALVMAVDKLMRNGRLESNPVIGQVAAVSAGIVRDVVMLDLCYAEDGAAQADMNVVMNQKGEFIEIQGTGEGRSFSRAEMDALLSYAQKGIRMLMRAQRKALQTGYTRLPFPRLVVASANDYKLKELSWMFQDICELVSMMEVGFRDEIAETGMTFEENAVLKAEAVMKATGLPALADDSGLIVEALGGAPGIYSARYAGAHGQDRENNRLLLKNMEGITDRRCQFVCAMAVAIPGETTRVVLGQCAGTLLKEERGERGFGYDPLFLYETGETFAEMRDRKKNRVSHRAKAAEEMRKVLAEVF